MKHGPKKNNKNIKWKIFQKKNPHDECEVDLHKKLKNRRKMVQEKPVLRVFVLVALKRKLNNKNPGFIRWTGVRLECQKGYQISRKTSSR